MEAEAPVSAAFPKQRRRRVASKRSSHINVPLEWLDWSNWWVDTSFDLFYLHVAGNPAADPTDEYGLSDRAFRVYPRRKEGERASLEMKDGELWWVIR